MSRTNPHGELLGFRPNRILRGDGAGGWQVESGELQVLHKSEGEYIFPFGIAQMDNGEIILVSSWRHDDRESPVAAFSRDSGDTWTDFQPLGITVPKGIAARPLGLVDLGGGCLTFQCAEPFFKRCFSDDYGRTWSETPSQPAANGKGWAFEGEPLVERDADGKATRLAEVGWQYGGGATGGTWVSMIRWSEDGGRTWINESAPEEWLWQSEHGGKSFDRGVSEGSLVRAANGDIVAALRTDIPARYYAPYGKMERPHEDGYYSDPLEGIAVSISKDDGETWSPMQFLWDAGRHHPYLILMPDGDIVMTLIVRQDIVDGQLASYDRGCEAVLSKDNGRTWDLGGEYILDGFAHLDKENWLEVVTGHQYSTLLDDGRILTCYGAYLRKGATLIRWKPGE